MEQIERNYPTDLYKDLARVAAMADACGPGMKVVQDEPHIGLRIMPDAFDSGPMPVVYRTADAASLVVMP